jgi:HlyD family secretion protein
MSANGKKKRTGRIVLVAVLALAAAVTAGTVYFRNRLKTALNGGYEVVQVTRGTLEVTVHGSGAVKSLDTQTVYARTAGKVDEVRVKEGDEVKAGDVIALFDSSSLSAQIESLESRIRDIDTAFQSLRATEGSAVVKSPAAGVVKAVYVARGDDVDAVAARYGCLLVLSVDGRMRAEIPISDPSTVWVGQSVRATVGGETVDAWIVDIDADAGTFTVTLADGGYAVGAAVSVATEEGAAIGVGALSVNMPLYVTDACGVVTDVYVKAGDSVGRGASLFKREGSIPSAELKAQIDARAGLEKDLAQARADLEDLVVTAPMDGIVTDLVLTPGKPVQEGLAMFTVLSRDRLKRDVEVDELDISSIEEGQSGAVTLDALPGKQFAATVIGIHPVGRSTNNVTRFTVTLAFDGGRDVLIGMSASVDIVTAVSENALLVPVEAIQTIGGGHYVILGADAGAATADHEVKTGLTDGTYIEILDGLTESDTVIIPGKTVDGLSGLFASRMGRSTSTASPTNSGDAP